MDINTNLNDKFTFYFYQYLNGLHTHQFTEKTKMKHLPALFPRSILDSNVEVKNLANTNMHLKDFLPLHN